jgi:hypothetical protein
MKIFQLTEEMDIQPSFITTILSSFIISHGFLDFFKFRNFEQDFIWYIIIILSNYFLFKTVPVLSLLYFMYLSVDHFNNDILFIVKKYNLGNGWEKINEYGFGSSIFLGTLLGEKNGIFYNTIIYYLTNNKSNAKLIYGLFLLYNLQQYLYSYYYYQTKERLLAISLITGGFILGPFYFILYYLSFIHLPIAIYKLVINRNERDRMKIIHIFLSMGFILNRNVSSVLNLEYNYNIIKNVIYLGISILTTHMIFAKLTY